MKKIVFAIACLFSIASADVFQGFDVNYKSKYVSRGTIFEGGLAANEGSSVVFSDAWISNNGLTFTAFTSTYFPENSPKTNEADIFVDYKREFFGVTFDAGVNYYTFPNSTELSQYSSTGELTFYAQKTIGHFMFGVNFYKDFIQSEGIYITPNLKTTWTVNDFTINTNTSLGYVDSKHNLYMRGIEEDGISDITLDLEVKYTVPFHKNLVLGMDVHEAYQPEISTSNNPGWQGIFFGSGVGYSW